jgi:hypothetical protein
MMMTPYFFPDATIALEAKLNTQRRSPSLISPSSRRRRIGLEVLPRGLSRTQAAALTGLSPTAFDRARREGKYPSPTLPGGKYDRTLIERSMDRYSGIDDEDTPASALNAWRNRGSRSH